MWESIALISALSLFIYNLKNILIINEKENHREKNASSFSFFYKARKELLFKNCVRQL